MMKNKSGLIVWLMKTVLGAWCVVLAACTAMAELVEYRDYDANTGTFTNAVRECTLVTSETRTLENGWYAVEGAVTIPADANLTVNGTAHLILCDGAKLTILNPGDHRNAVYVSKAASLIIYGQTAGTGALTVTGGNFSAGIGGGCCGAGGGVGGDSGSVSGDNHANEMPVSLCGTNGLDVATEENGSETDLFLSLDGIDGESKDPRHDLWIDLLNIYHGDASLEGTDIPEYFSRGVTESIVIKHLVDEATPKIQKLYMNGGSIDWGCVEYTRTVAGGQAFSYRVEFEGLQVVSAVVESEELPDGAFQLVETVKFLFNRQTWQAEDLPREVTIGNHPHLSAAYTSGRGTVTNAIDGTSFTVPVGTKHVKVIFTAESGWEIMGDAVVEIDTMMKNIVFGEESGYKVPKVVSDHPSISPGEPLGPFVTAQEATNMSKRAVFAPSAEVEAKLGKGSDALKTYCDMFGFEVVPTSDGKWSVAALPTPEAWTNVVLSARSATRQILVADIAALGTDGKKNVAVTNCVPGFYYTLYGAAGVRALPMTGTAYGSVLCGTDRDVEFSGVAKPSAAAGFFTISVKDTPDIQHD